MLTRLFGIKFEDFFSLSGLIKLDQSFLSYLSQQDFKLYAKYVHHRAEAQPASTLEISELLIEVAKYLEDFLVEIFCIETENSTLKKNNLKFAPVYECRRKFVQRYALTKYSSTTLASLSYDIVVEKLQTIIGEINQENIVQYYFKWSTQKDRYQQELDILAQYCAFAVYRNSEGALFDVPRSIGPDLISKYRIEALRKNLYLGFNYRDHEVNIQKSFMNTKYCLYCHKLGKDSCKTGLEDANNASIEKNGCPLKQKISEKNLLSAQGFYIGALAMIIIDNPMVAVTGHRICNDCMKSCIYQKQTAVNIPVIESNILEQILNLPWGVEIYLLLTKWNPLNLLQPLPNPNSKYNVLVAGLGPAGFAISYYLLRAGHNVVAIDGLKIEKLDFDPLKPIKWWKDITTPLSHRIPQGFGGVMEYGITNRWDKNKLLLIRLILERFETFTMQGGVRLGSNITTQQAFASGFNHIALCLGAGKPKYITKEDFFVKGIRPAVDFLMSLQQGGAFLEESDLKLMIRFPSVVIGCGLTAIDSAVELLHYYALQVEKFLYKCEVKQIIISTLPQAEQIIADEFISHAKLLRRAKTPQEKFAILNDVAGGVTICYRKSLNQSPAYILNHEEIEHALSIGINFKENFDLQEILTDQFRHVSKIISKDGTVLDAKTILVAIGIEDNEFLDIKNLIKGQDNLFLNAEKNISYLGDCNPKYSGSVVKALASAKDNYQKIDKEIRQLPYSNFSFNIEYLINKVTKIERIAEDLLVIEIYSPYLVSNFRPGQFFKFQHYTSEAKNISKPIALSGFKVDQKRRILVLCVFGENNIDNILKYIELGSEIPLMGPTGSPVPVFKGKRVLLIGENFNNLILMPVAEILYKNNCNITLLTQYDSSSKIYYKTEIEKFAETIIWSLKKPNKINIRVQDILTTQSLLETLQDLKKKRLSNDFDVVICYVSPAMQDEISQVKNEIFNSNINLIYPLYTPMQCMMKGICGHCIYYDQQRKEYVFACQKQYKMI
ncbi:MAG: 2-polyprenylphenol hydroxylase [Rickettsiaceae bacterium]|nr:2-polyprenylphenol hydroxylase [Rickettsiaceae bacterium]